MKNLKNWKIVNYINTDVLFRDEKPKCIVARSENAVRSDIPSVNFNQNHFYILHWLEDTKADVDHQLDIIKDAARAWNYKKCA